MARRLILAGLAAVIAAPSLAAAQPRDPACVRSNEQTTATGAVLGAVGGAIIGNMVAGHHDRTVGTVGGALAGGVVGGAIASTNNEPCPPGYYRPAPPPTPAYGPPPPPAYGPPPPGYDRPHGEGFWRDAPPEIHERIDFLYRRITDAQADGRISRREARELFRQLDGVRRQEDQLRDRDGGRLSPPDRDYLQGRLDDLSRRIHWEAERR